MKAWWQRIWAICLLRAGPQDLPASSTSLALALAAWWGVSALALAAPGTRVQAADALLLFVAQLAMIAGLLVASRRSARFLQTAAALFACGAVVSLANVPLWLSTASPPPAGLAVLALAALFWSLAVDAHIWRHALERSYVVGLAVAVVLFVVQLVLLQALGTAS